jgi:hypothetical protein
MICPPCREAGESAALSRLAMSSLLRESQEKRARNFHRKCRGGTWCDCAHKLEGVNWQDAGLRKLQESNLRHSESAHTSGG